MRKKVVFFVFCFLFFVFCFLFFVFCFFRISFLEFDIRVVVGWYMACDQLLLGHLLLLLGRLDR
jgi:hypothetical protein